MLGAARSTVQDNLKRAEAAGLAWPLGAEITDAVLEQRLFARAGVRPGVRGVLPPNLVDGAQRRGGSNRTGARWHARPSGRASI